MNTSSNTSRNLPAFTETNNASTNLNRNGRDEKVPSSAGNDQPSFIIAVPTQPEDPNSRFSAQGADQIVPLTPAFKPVLPDSATPEAVSTASSPAKRKAKRSSRRKKDRYTLQKDHGFWQVTYKGKTAILKHEAGMDYVAYLMAHPNEYIHGLALALKVRAVRKGQEPESVDVIQERSLALDDAEAVRRVYQKQRQLEAIIEDPEENDFIKTEIQNELREIYAFQNRNEYRTHSVAQKASDSVGRAIKRLVTKLSKPGMTSLLLRSFGIYIHQHILIPSGRGLHGGARSPIAAGMFVCDLNLRKGKEPTADRHCED